ncbi:DUF5107 domain-containing protein [Caldilinea sp.]|uniref:DUF5107 domain-containing protein n=1 Tax=Caldilinea sp. TaxID=2293560 RepID=UPI002C3337CB|nr:DUF5107 domain-containing protein [Caldilinea sp.]
MTDPHQSVVSVHETKITIPTYGIGQPQKNPLFLEKRVYQGSSGAVYPYPVVERVEANKADKQYTAIFLENRYLLIMLLPEIGGRVQMALDKTNDYHFVYYNRVIKPALVGLTGPWISGGIEFNWPQHHRPTTFSPVDYRIEAHADGSQTVWMGEIERMFRTQSMAGFRLYPDRAYLEIDVQLYNRTPFPQTFLWWANPAVHVNDDYQSIFPPDVFAVMDHGKRAVSSFPIATGAYYKVDYSPGTDISRYKNIPVPTSYMAYHSDFDFLGCYDHGRQAGMLHVANHHLVPGKKQWTWGNSNFGQTWDRQLTDADGPYIELMCGAFTDNQPDFSWLQPGEEKRFTQVFMPFKTIGGVKNASPAAVLNLEISEGCAQLGVYLTSPRTVTVTLTAANEVCFRQDAALSPEAVFQTTVALPIGVLPQQVTLRVSEGERTLLAFTPLPDKHLAPPQPATPARPPAELATNEELFLNGLHLEQYRHATYDAEPYYVEALRRDPLDSRCNNALGLRRLRQGQFAEAEGYFRRAVERLTLRNPNPYDGEPYYNLGLALRWQGRDEEAFDAFYKATWNAAWQDAAYFELARLAARRGNDPEALELVERCLARNGRHYGAFLLQAALLRRSGRSDEAAAAIATGLAYAPLHYGLHFEQFLLTDDHAFHNLVQDDAGTLIELALEYAHAGCFDAADRLLADAPPHNPMVHYYRGWLRLQAGDATGADVCFALGATAAPDYCFPNEVECAPALTAAMARQPQDARAPFYLGTFLYAHHVYDAAIELWERSAALDPDFATVQRNLGLAYMNQRGDGAGAQASYARAFALDPTDSRVFFELDQLDKKLGKLPAARLAQLAAHQALVDKRDDLTVEYVTLLNLTGRYAEALAILLARTFHPWEGGEGKVSGQYVTALMELAKTALAAGDAVSAIEHLKRARSYPDNLAEGKLSGAQENAIDYWLGRAYGGLGNQAEAATSYRRAAQGEVTLSAAMYYNDRSPDLVLYQALSHAALGEAQQATAICEQLVEYGQAHRNDKVTMDYFAVSLPDFLVFYDDLTRRNQIHCAYMEGLGYLGLQHQDEAIAAFDDVLQQEPAHWGATLHRKMTNEFVVASVRPAAV